MKKVVVFGAVAAAVAGLVAVMVMKKKKEDKQMESGEKRYVDEMKVQKIQYKDFGRKKDYVKRFMTYFDGDEEFIYLGKQNVVKLSVEETIQNIGEDIYDELLDGKPKSAAYMYVVNHTKKTYYEICIDSGYYSDYIGKTHFERRDNYAFGV